MTITPEQFRRFIKDFNQSPAGQRAAFDKVLNQSLEPVKTNTEEKIAGLMAEIEKAEDCNVVGHKLEWTGMGGEGRVYQCVREKQPLPEAWWPKYLRKQADERYR